ncbi:hypothetical protein [Halococcoides cellulosivorans]|uniref:hypothetical protein n=1 Tax=Halococcoides cellulosivorans TaxID=1679096 RepID=UPI00131F41AE|nr:hypothetical protein [Halococcoides cellulosivorans]
MTLLDDEDRPYLILLSVIILVFVTTVAGTKYMPTNVINMLGQLNLALFASFLTSLVVRRELYKKELNKENKIRQIALDQLSESLADHLVMMSHLYTAGKRTKFGELPQTWIELYNRDLSETIGNADWSAEDSTSGKRPWIEWLNISHEKLSNDIEDVLGTYGRVMDPQMVELLENISNSDLYNHIRTMNNANPDSLNFSKAAGPIALKSGQLQEYQMNIRELLKIMDEADVGIERPIRNTPLHQDNYFPEFGIARLEPSEVEAIPDDISQKPAEIDLSKIFDIE